MISGFIIHGGETRKVLVRARTKSRRIGVSDTIDDPYILVYEGDQIVVANDDWGGHPRSSEIPDGLAPLYESNLPSCLR